MSELADYRLDVYNNSGVLQGVMAGTAEGGAANQAGFLSLACVRRVNTPGLLIVTLRGDHPILSSLADKWQFELWRKPEGVHLGEGNRGDLPGGTVELRREVDDRIILPWDHELIRDESDQLPGGYKRTSRHSAASQLRRS